MQDKILSAIALFSGLIAFSIALWWRKYNTLTCWEYSDNCHVNCPYGTFLLPGMIHCNQWLHCDVIKHLHKHRSIGHGLVKKVFLTYWEDKPVAYSELRHSDYQDDFLHGLYMLKSFQGSPFVIQLIGFCNNVYLTQFHQLQSLDNLEAVLSNEKYTQFNNVSVRFRLCIDYVNVLMYLHNSPLGIRVMCDSNDLQKTLQQFLLTEQFHVLVNDLDALPEVNYSQNKMIKCGHRQLFGDFVAPEQLWKHPYKLFNETEMSGYNEKTDIWKIPDVCNYLLGTSSDNQILKFYLFNCHKKCKHKNPQLRPSAQEVLNAYQNILKELKL